MPTMAEPAVLATLGWLAAPMIKILINKAYDHLGTDFKKRWKKLEATVFPRLSLAIEKAEKSPKKEELLDWLKRLKGAYYEAEEIIDLLDYKKIKKEVKDNRKPLEQKGKKKRLTRISIPSHVAFAEIKKISSVLSRKKIMQKGCIDKLIDIAEEAKKFLDLLEDQTNYSGSDADRETISEPPAKVFGRERDKKNIVNVLKKKSSSSDPGPSTRPAIPIIAINGRSGVGKTVLAQNVYKHFEENSYFDLHVWVHTPREFKATNVIKKMIEIINAKECISNYSPSTSLEALLMQIKHMVGSKKLLLVLDDFWSDTVDFVAQWEKFIGCLSSCSLESRILLTAQSKNAAKQTDLVGVTKVKTYYLREIEEDQFYKLFMHYAWPRNCNLQKEEFKKVGRKIAIKLKGDPGAAKLVGHLVSGNLDQRYWEEVAEKDWLGDNMKASYQQLSPDLKRCFAICSLFPKGTKFRREFLIDFWMAEGFIRPIDKQERLEDIGDNYLCELISRFFLEQVDKKGIYYQLHDLFHDLAEWVQGDDFIRIDSTNVPSHISHKLSRSENIRHIYLPSSMINQVKEKLCLMKNLCTLFVQSDGVFVPMKLLEEILKNLKKLRVLSLHDFVDDLPDSIGNLKHLRYLKINGYGPLKKLPDSICKLYHLQTLFLPDCESLPKNFSELISLRSLATCGKTMSHIFMLEG